MQETGERTGRGSEAPGWAMSRSEIAIVEGDLATALDAVRGARRSELAPLEGWVDPLWIDLHEASLLLETGDLDQAEALLPPAPGPALLRGRPLRRRLAVGRPHGGGGPGRATWRRPGPPWPPT